MNKSGYDQFFKAAKKAKTGGTSVGPGVAKRSNAETEAKIRQALKMRPAKKSKPFPFVPVIAGLLFIAAGLGYLEKPELFEQMAQHVQFKFMGQADAEEKAVPAGKTAAKDAASETAGSAKDAAATQDGKKNETATKAQAVAEDTSYIEKLRSRKEELDLREKELNQLEEELQRQKVEVDNRVRQLEQMRRDIASVLKERTDADETQVNKLVDLYSTMKPKQAADVLGTLQEDLSVQVLGKMKKKNAAEIMNLLPADKARTLSEKLTGYKR